MQSTKPDRPALDAAAAAEKHAAEKTGAVHQGVGQPGQGQLASRRVVYAPRAGRCT